jgi:sugar lactone lactonase YvrE
MMRPNALCCFASYLLLVASSKSTCCAAPGDLFVAEYGSGKIYEFNSSGGSSVFASGLNGPAGLAFDKSGNLYASIYWDGTVDKFTPSGGSSTIATGIYKPQSLAFDSSGNLYVVESNPFGSGPVIEFLVSGGSSTFASGFNNPQGLAFDSGGNLFVEEYGLFSGQPANIYKLAPSGSTSLFSGGLPGGSAGLAFDTHGSLFATDYGAGPVGPGKGSIFQFNSTGVRSTFASGLTNPNCLAFDGSGNLFASAGDTSTAGAIYEFSPSGGSSAFATGFNEPYGLAFAPNPVPEPAALPLFFSAAFAVATCVWCRKRPYSSRASGGRSKSIGRGLEPHGHGRMFSGKF